jgi:hypothetical protein
MTIPALSDACQIAGDVGQNQVAIADLKYQRIKSGCGCQEREGQNGGHRSGDEHPVLAVKAKERKVLDREMQRPRALILRAE